MSGEGLEGVTLTEAFWRETLDRAVKSAAQTLLILWGGDTVFNVLEVDWTVTAGVAGGAAVLSVLTSLGSLRLGQKGTPSVL